MDVDYRVLHEIGWCEGVQKCLFLCRGINQTFVRVGNLDIALNHIVLHVNNSLTLQSVEIIQTI